MVFFQGSVLAGYLYAHGLTRYCRLNIQIIVHVALLVLGLSFLPFALQTITPPSTDSELIGWLLKQMSLVILIPTFIVCTTAPLLQRWFTHTDHHHAQDPYYLYAASNAGSLIGLLLFPFLIEPWLGIHSQNYAWFGLYILFSLLLLALFIRLWNQDYQDDAVDHQAKAPSWSTRLRWILLAFTPSSLFIGLTTSITTDIASVPLLWVIPLALYMATFILCFSHKPFFPHRYVINNQAFLFIPLFVLLPYSSQTPPITLIEAHIIAFLGCALMCHGELYRLRPNKQFLTEFYIFLALGGLCGGMLNSILAPKLFNSLIEYPLVLALAYLLRPTTQEQPSYFKWSDLIIPTITLVVVLLTHIFSLSLFSLAPSYASLIFNVIYYFIAVLAFANFNRSVTFGLCILLLFSAHHVLRNYSAESLYQTRNFFGVLKVHDNPVLKTRYLMHGTTLHGTQSYAKPPRFEYSYYVPVGDLVSTVKQARTSQIAIVGMGTGTSACLAKAPQNRLTFYEIDPDVIKIANDERFFTYLRDCPPTSIVLGDGRIQLQKADDYNYDLIIIDAFSSDAIPTHLINLNAVQLYLSKLQPEGIIAFHISNRYLNLVPVLGRIAVELNLKMDYLHYQPSKDISANTAIWVALSADDNLAHKLNKSFHWTRLDPHHYTRHSLWTDDFSNILSALK